MNKENTNNDKIYESKFRLILFESFLFKLFDILSCSLASLLLIFSLFLFFSATFSRDLNSYIPVLTF